MWWWRSRVADSGSGTGGGSPSSSSSSSGDLRFLPVNDLTALLNALLTRSRQPIAAKLRDGSRCWLEGL